MDAPCKKLSAAWPLIVGADQQMPATPQPQQAPPQVPLQPGKESISVLLDAQQRLIPSGAGRMLPGDAAPFALSSSSSSTSAGGSKPALDGEYRLTSAGRRSSDPNAIDYVVMGEDVVMCTACEMLMRSQAIYRHVQKVHGVKGANKYRERVFVDVEQIRASNRERQRRHRDRAKRLKQEGRAPGGAGMEEAGPTATGGAGPSSSALPPANNNAVTRMLQQQQQQPTALPPAAASSSSGDMMSLGPGLLPGSSSSSSLASTASVFPGGSPFHHLTTAAPPRVPSPSIAQGVNGLAALGASSPVPLLGGPASALPPGTNPFLQLQYELQQHHYQQQHYHQLHQQLASLHQQHYQHYQHQQQHQQHLQLQLQLQQHLQQQAAQLKLQQEQEQGQLLGDSPLHQSGSLQQQETSETQSQQPVMEAPEEEPGSSSLSVDHGPPGSSSPLLCLSAVMEAGGDSPSLLHQRASPTPSMSSTTSIKRPRDEQQQQHEEEEEQEA